MGPPGIVEAVDVATKRGADLECRAMISAGSSAHGSLLSRELCPLKTEFPLTRPVQNPEPALFNNYI
jgi:hypothetical protein